MNEIGNVVFVCESIDRNEGLKIVNAVNFNEMNSGYKSKYVMVEDDFKC